MNNDCNSHSHCHCHYMQRIYEYFILPCLVLPFLALSCLESTSITIVIIGMTLYELVLHYNIISYHISCTFILSLLLIWSADLISIVFYSTLFQIDWIRFYSIEFDSILLNLIYYIVQYCISYQWMICVCQSICPSVCLSICLFICMNNFSLFSLLYSSFFSLSFLMIVFLTHTQSNSHKHTATQIHMNIRSFLWLVHIST